MMFKKLIQRYQEKKLKKKQTKQKEQISPPIEESNLTKPKRKRKGLKPKKEKKSLKIKKGYRISKSKRGYRVSKSQKGHQAIKRMKGYQAIKTQKGHQTLKRMQQRQTLKPQEEKQGFEFKKNYRTSKSQKGHQAVKAQKGYQALKAKKGYQATKAKKGYQPLLKKKDQVLQIEKLVEEEYVVKVLREAIAEAAIETPDTTVPDEVKKQQKEKKKVTPWRIFKIFLLIVLLISLLLIGYGLWLTFRVNQLITDAYVPIEVEIVREVPLEFGDEPFSVLLLGIDTDDITEYALSDVIMLLSVNPNENSTVILSLAREMWLDTDITWPSGIGMLLGDEEKHIFDRLAYMYTFLGPEGAINIIQELLDVPIDRFIALDMVGFSLIIDELGGMTVYNNTAAFSHGGHDFPLGYLELNGEQALSFVRTRQDDPVGDFGRQARQRLVVNAALSLIEESIVLRHNDILNAADGHLRMNLNTGDVMTVLMNYMGAAANVSMHDLRGEFHVIDDQHLFIVVDDEDIAEMSELLREHLELD